MTEASVSLYFRWIMFRPDQRTYRQNSIELFPCTEQSSDLASTFPPLVQVKIPLDGEYLANAKDIIEKQMSGELSPTPILTLAGMRYVQDQFDAVLYDTEVPDEKEDAPKATVEGGWSDDWDTTETASSGPTDVATGPDVKDDEWTEVGADDANAPWKEDWGK